MTLTSATEGRSWKVRPRESSFVSSLPALTSGRPLSNEQRINQLNLELSDAERDKNNLIISYEPLNPSSQPITDNLMNDLKKVLEYNMRLAIDRATRATPQKKVDLEQHLTFFFKEFSTELENLPLREDQGCPIRLTMGEDPLSKDFFSLSKNENDPDEYERSHNKPLQELYISIMKSGFPPKVARSNSFQRLCKGRLNSASPSSGSQSLSVSGSSSVFPKFLLLRSTSFGRAVRRPSTSKVSLRTQGGGSSTSVSSSPDEAPVNKNNMSLLQDSLGGMNEFNLLGVIKLIDQVLTENPMAWCRFFNMEGVFRKSPADGSLKNLPGLLNQYSQNLESIFAAESLKSEILELAFNDGHVIGTLIKQTLCVLSEKHGVNWSCLFNDEGGVKTDLFDKTTKQIKDDLDVADVAESLRFVLQFMHWVCKEVKEDIVNNKMNSQALANVFVLNVFPRRPVDELKQNISKLTKLIDFWCDLTT